MKNLPKLVELLEALIAAPSVSSISPRWDQSNRAVIELLEGWLSDLGFQVEVLPIPGYAGKYNLIASIGSGPEGLILAGHTDTVPCDEPLWSHDPFRLMERDRRYYGLGTADMKSFFALVIEALRDFELGNLTRPLTILATADEESTMCGAQYLHDINRTLGRHALIGEPTGLRPVRMHKGITMETIRLHGRSGHSSDPSLGVSALEGMYHVIGELLRWRDELQAAHRNPLFEVAVPTLNLGHIHGGDNPNRICGECELQIDIRPLPGMEIEELRGILRQRIEGVLTESELRLELESPFAGIPPLNTPASAAIVRAAEELTGHSAGAVAFGTEGPYLERLGAETLILGAGDIEQAHRPDEYLALDRIPPMVQLIRSLVERFCR